VGRTTGVEVATGSIVTGVTSVAGVTTVTAGVFTRRGSAAFVGSSVAHEDISNIMETRMTEQKTSMRVLAWTDSIWLDCTVMRCLFA